MLCYVKTWLSKESLLSIVIPIYRKSEEQLTSYDCRPTVGRQITNSLPTGHRQTTDRSPTVYRQSAKEKILH